MKWWHGLLALGVLVVCLVAFAPARLITIWEPRLGPHLRHIEGTLWDANADVVVGRKTIGLLSWQLRWSALFRSRLAADIGVEGPQLNLSANTVLDEGNLLVDLEGTVSPQILNPILIHYEVQASGTLHLEGVRFRLSTAGELNELAGSVRWLDGDIRYRLGSQTREFSSAGLVGHFDAKDGAAILNVVDSASGQPILRQRLELQSGWLHIRGFTRLLELADYPMPQLNNDDFVFEVSQQVIQRETTP